MKKRAPFLNDGHRRQNTQQVLRKPLPADSAFSHCQAAKPSLSKLSRLLSVSFSCRVGCLAAVCQRMPSLAMLAPKMPSSSCDGHAATAVSRQTSLSAIVRLHDETCKVLEGQVVLWLAGGTTSSCGIASTSHDWQDRSVFECGIRTICPIAEMTTYVRVGPEYSTRALVLF